MLLFSYFLGTFSLLLGRPPKSLFRYFFVTLIFSGFRALWDLLPFTTPRGLEGWGLGLAENRCFGNLFMTYCTSSSQQLFLTYSCNVHSFIILDSSVKGATPRYVKEHKMVCAIETPIRQDGLHNCRNPYQTLRWTKVCDSYQRTASESFNNTLMGIKTLVLKRASSGDFQN